MSRKVDPRANRVGITKGWNSLWFADDKLYSKNLIEDYYIRKLLGKELRKAGLDKINIERSIKTLKIIIHVARPGVVIGRKGSELGALRIKLAKLTKSELDIQIEEIKKPEISAGIVSDTIAMQLERRMSARKSMNIAATKAMDAGAKGIKIVIKGTIYGPSTIGTTLSIYKGAIPTQTLRADIDFAKSVAHTIGGTLGTKVWIYKGNLII